MRRRARALLGVAAAAAAAVGVAAASRVPYGSEQGGAWLRLSWRAPGELVEECREPTEEELAALPAHMRQPRVCQGRVLPYRLRLRVDGDPALDRRVEPAGARGDRPITVFEEMSLSPGPHSIEVSFERLEGPAPGAGPSNAERPGSLPIEAGEGGRAQELEPHAEGPEAVESGSGVGQDRNGRPATLPPLLRLSRSFVVEERDVALVTYDPEQRVLTLSARVSPHDAR